jgi:hypothetical protein
MKNRQAGRRGLFCTDLRRAVHSEEVQTVYYRRKCSKQAPTVPAPGRAARQVSTGRPGAGAMSARQVEKTLCLQCSTVLDVGEAFCRRCGARTAPSRPGMPRESAAGAATAEPVPGRAKAWHKIAESRGLVLLLLFAALGPLPLPFYGGARGFPVRGRSC